MRCALRIPHLAAFATLIATVSGCAGTVNTHRASSVVQYLYPNRGPVVEKPGIPVLELPLRVGIAFVPDDEGSISVGYSYERPGVLNEADRLMLMNDVARQFREQAFVKSIELIPTAYLTPHGSFANLEQIRTMFDVDIVALISYDQVQFSAATKKSFVYWTILGAYVIEGEKNDTRTMLDAVVYDIKSRKLLFRAPGVSAVNGASSAADKNSELAADRKRGFDEASKDLATNLDRQLEYFKQRVKDKPDEIRVVATAEYRDRARVKGGGSLDWMTALAIVLLGLARMQSTRPRDVRARPIVR